MLMSAFEMGVGFQVPVCPSTTPSGVNGGLSPQSTLRGSVCVHVCVCVCTSSVAASCMCVLCVSMIPSVLMFLMHVCVLTGVLVSASCVVQCWGEEWCCV